MPIESIWSEYRSGEDIDMRLPPLVEGTMIRRYKRFLADVELCDGTRVTAHCPNTGTMRSCWEPGARVQLSRSDNPKRKLPWTLERVDMGAGWVGVHTGRVNGVIAEAIEQQRISGLCGYAQLRREVTLEWEGLARSRLDLVLSQGSRPDAYIEVKNVTLFAGDRLWFPDAVTVRGRKHLENLVEVCRSGARGVMLYALNRPEGRSFSPAHWVDPVYAERLREAVEEGVETLAVRILHGCEGMSVGEPVVIDLSAAPPPENV